MICYRIIQELELVVICCTGDITPEVVMPFVDELVRIPGYNPGYNSLIDLRGSNLIYDVAGIRRALQHLANVEGYIARRKTAYITSSSVHVVPPMLMNAGSYDFPMEIKVHSTTAAAISWLGLKDFSEEDYQQLLQSICND